MDWIRENKPLAIIFGVIIAGTLVLGYFLYDAWSTYDEAKTAYLGLGNQVTALKSARLGPTEKNLQSKQKVVDEYATEVNKLGMTMLILQPKVEALKDIEFQAKLKAKISDVRTASGQAGMQLPAEFSFGFDEYTHSLPTSAAAATELSGYLDAMDKLVELFMKCKVQSLDKLERSRLSVESQPAAANNAAAQGQAQQNQQAPSGIMEKQQITTVLTLDQGALQLLVSRLATTEMPYFTSLRLLRIENQSQDGPMRSEIRLSNNNANVTPGGAVATKPEESAPDEIKPPPPAAEDTVSVFGREYLKVRMEIDLVKFLDAARGVAAAPAGR